VTNDSVDIIVAINGEPVIGMNSIISYLSSNTRPGDTVVMTVLRDGALLDVNVTLGERPRN
jgi:S1-C subfamily serine protease